MANKSRQQVNAERNVIQQRLLENHTPQEITKELGISDKTFYKYRAKIVKECAAKFEAQRLHDIGFYADQFTDRLTKDLRVLDDKLKDATGKDAAAIIQIKLEVEKTLFDFNLQGLELVDRIRTQTRIEVISNGDNNANSPTSTTEENSNNRILR